MRGTAGVLSQSGLCVHQIQQETRGVLVSRERTPFPECKTLSVGQPGMGVVSLLPLSPELTRGAYVPSCRL